jgi:hypothetical protein
LKLGVFFLIFIAVPCVSQKVSTGTAETTGACSPAVTGSENTFTITCGIGKKQGQKILAILNYDTHKTT